MPPAGVGGIMTNLTEKDIMKLWKCKKCNIRLAVVYGAVDDPDFIGETHAEMCPKCFKAGKKEDIAISVEIPDDKTIPCAECGKYPDAKEDEDGVYYEHRCPGAILGSYAANIKAWNLMQV